MKKIPSWLENLGKVIYEVIKNAGNITIFSTAFGVVGTFILQYFTGFLTLQFMIPLWLIILLPLAGISMCSIISFAKRKREHAYPFMCGDKVNIKSNTRKVYLVSGYHYFRYKKVKLTDPAKPEEEPISINENLLEGYVAPDPSPLRVYSHPRRNNRF